MTPRILLLHIVGVVSARLDDPSSTDDPESNERRWNALIGVVTAIVGNILISFALNLQRYAHIRVHKQHLEASRAWANGVQQKKFLNRNASYGTQAQIAEERAELNRTSPGLENGEAADENTPLQGTDSMRSDTDTSRLPVKKDDEDEIGDPKSYLKSPYWWVGILLMTAGEAGNFLAYGFAPASIVSPLGVVALISNCVIAPCLLREAFRMRDFGGVVIAVAGAVTVVLSAKSNERRMGPDEIWDAITRWEFEVYLGLTGAAIVGLVWASKRYGHKTILIDLGLVGLFGEYTALSTKGIASLLSDTLWRVITFPITYLLAAILVSTAFMQIHYINRALQRFPSTQVIPTQFVLFTISVIIGSAVLYRDFESATADQVGKFVGGCIMTFAGVYLITSGRPPQEQDNTIDEEAAANAEESIGLIDAEAGGASDAATGLAEEQPDPQTPATTRRRSLGFQTSARPSSSRTPVRSLLNRQQSDRSHTSQRRRHPREVSAFSAEPHQLSTSTPPHADGGGGSSFVSIPSPSSITEHNPWASSEGPPVSSHISPLRREASSTLESVDSLPSTPGGGGGDHQERPILGDGFRSQTTPGSQEALTRPNTAARKGTSRLVPGPLFTPLSSSLSGIVADNLRKGLDSPAALSARRRHFGSAREAGLLRPEDASSQSQLSPGISQPALPTQESLEEEQVKNRSKSVSEEGEVGFGAEAGGGSLRPTSIEGPSGDGDVDGGDNERHEER